MSDDFTELLQSMVASLMMMLVLFVTTLRFSKDEEDILGQRVRPPRQS